MKKFFWFLAMLVILLNICCTPCFAGWIIFHKPPYKGKLIDAETKEPIEGATVVAIYQKHPFISGPAGGSDSIVTVKEALTDKNGEFRIPSCFALMGPNSYEEYTNFIFYKPGYGRCVAIVSKLGGDATEYYFLEENYGKKKEIFDYHPRRNLGEGIYGIVELKPAKTWEERRKASWISMPTDDETDTPLLYEMRENESNWLRKNKGWRR